MTQQWHPHATHQAVKARSALLKQVRDFFESKDVLEVETPILSHHGTTDPYIESIQTSHGILQTSPEFAMKRLLCAQFGHIYQITKAFRQEESGRWHNPEFTMLEWYRVGFTHFDLMKEVDELLTAILDCQPADIKSYQQLFLDVLQLDPLCCSDQDLVNEINNRQLLAGNLDTLSRDDQLNLLFTHVIEPNLAADKPMFVWGYPASQSALARINPDDNRIADRFEVYYKGIELANGFFELADASEQLSRFENDNVERKRKGLNQVPVDKHLINALAIGLPDCAGVALGIDRLLMLKTGATHINQVLCFPYERA